MSIRQVKRIIKKLKELNKIIIISNNITKKIIINKNNFNNKRYSHPNTYLVDIKQEGSIEFVLNNMDEFQILFKDIFCY